VLIAQDIARLLDPVLMASDAGIIADAWQAKLLRDPPRRGLLCCSRQSGKSTVCALIALHDACFAPGALIVIVAPSQRQSAELLRSIRLLHGKLDGVPALANESVLKLELENQARILALPSGEGGKTIRGLAGARLVIVDEAARVEDDVFAAVRPMLATNAAGKLILLSTPAGRRGTFHDLFHNGDETWQRVRVPASDCPRITKEFLDEERRELGEARFREEYCLEFIDSDTAAFSSELIDAAFDPEVRPLWL
jgi:hypothetical protein